MQNYASNFGLITLVGTCSVTSIAITSTLIGYMIRNTEKLIETSLYTTVVLYVGVGIVGMVMNQLMMGLVGFGLAAL
jgi:NADH:ubiquinone oxidoreductase subunit D